jgi:hypothetical protein
VTRASSVLLRIVRVAAVLAVLFGVGAAGSSFPSNRNSKGIDTGVFANGLLALVGLKDPADGEMFPVWVGRICVVAGVGVAIGITALLDRDRRRVAERAATEASDGETGWPPPDVRG